MTKEPLRRHAPVRSAAPAKINLTLAVLGGAGPDGFHELRGIFARLALADELILAGRGPTTGADRDSLRLAPGSIPVEGDIGIVLRAAAALRDWAGRALPALHFELHKRIPMAAGLGGGSSDAAAALRLAAHAWELAIREEQLVAIGLGLGADVPFFLGRSPIALVGGRGERVEGLLIGSAGGTGVLLVTGGRKPSTAEIFRVHDDATRAGSRGGGSSLDRTTQLAHALRTGVGPGSLAALAPILRDGNDLYGAAASAIPGLDALRRAVEEALGRPAMLSGAGPTLFVLYPSQADAEDAGTRLGRRLAGREGSGQPVSVIATTIAAS